MRVRATQQGYYGDRRRYAGEVFEIEEPRVTERLEYNLEIGIQLPVKRYLEPFSYRWMEPATDEDKEELKKRMIEAKKFAKMNRKSEVLETEEVV